MMSFGHSKSFTKSNIKDVPDNKAVVYKIKNDSGKN